MWYLAWIRSSELLITVTRNKIEAAAELEMRDISSVNIGRLHRSWASRLRFW